jgi:hypothetical protein
VSDYLPSRLPVTCQFRLIIAFSVFTHLSERATRTCLATLRAAIQPTGVLVLTIRPPEYWSYAFSKEPGTASARLLEHESTGFAFQPHQRTPVDGDVTYGDTSMTLAWLAANAEGWRICDTPVTPKQDPLQTYVILRPR